MNRALVIRRRGNVHQRLHATGECAYEPISKLPGIEWAVEDALKRGIDQAERIAGGESGRLTCADAHGHDNE